MLFCTNIDRDYVTMEDRQDKLPRPPWRSMNSKRSSLMDVWLLAFTIPRRWFPLPGKSSWNPTRESHHGRLDPAWARRLDLPESRARHWARLVCFSWIPIQRVARCVMPSPGRNFFGPETNRTYRKVKLEEHPLLDVTYVPNHKSWYWTCPSSTIFNVAGKRKIMIVHMKKISRLISKSFNFGA